MPVSPADFNLWARVTGKKYPSTPEEKAAVAPEVHNFVRNFGKQGAVGEQPEEKQSNLASNLAKGALIAGGVAAGVAAARDPRVQQAVQTFTTSAAERASGVRENVQSFLSNLGKPRTVDQDIVRASGDVTPGPIKQQSGGAIVSDPWQEPDISIPQNRDLAAEATAMATALENIRSSKGQDPQQVYERIAAKRPEPSIGKDVEFKQEHSGLSPGRDATAVDPATGEIYAIGGGPSLVEKKLGIKDTPTSLVGSMLSDFEAKQADTQSQLAGMNVPSFIPGPERVPNFVRKASTNNDLSEVLNQLEAKQADTQSQLAGMNVPSFVPGPEQAPGFVRKGVNIGKVGSLQGSINPDVSQQTTAQEVAALVEPGVEYAAPEATTDTTNSLYSSPVTPDNRVPKVNKVFDNSLKGQHDIATTIDNETDNVLTRSQQFLERQAAADPTTGEIQIDPQLSLFGPREPRATIAGRPYRYTQLGRALASQYGTPDPTGEQFSDIRGLGITPKLKPGQLEGIDISNLSSDPKVATAQKQAIDIFQATGDTSFLRSAFGSGDISTPTTVTIGGRSVPTSKLFTPFKETEGGMGYEFEGGQIQRALDKLAPAEKFRATIQSLAQEQLGLPPGQTPTQEQLQALDPSTIRLLRSAYSGSQERQRAVDRAENFAALYKLRPEITEGVTQKPVVSSITGEYLGTRSAVERPGVYTPELYRMRASGGIGRQEVGGVGRRREMLASQEGYAPGGGSELESTTVLYKDPETGDVLLPNQVTEGMAAALTPIRGTAVEPQRIMGQQGRTYKGVGTQEIDPRSFDEPTRAQLAKSFPERVTPEGLIYSVQAMGGKKAAELRAQQQAARQAKDYATSIRLGAEMAPEEPGGTKSLPGIEQGEQLAKASPEELMGVIDSGTTAMQDAARAVLAAREDRQKQVLSLKASQELNRILKSGRPNATREARAYLKGLQEDISPGATLPETQKSSFTVNPMTRQINVPKQGGGTYEKTVYIEPNKIFSWYQ